MVEAETLVCPGGGRCLLLARSDSLIELGALELEALELEGLELEALELGGSEEL